MCDASAVSFADVTEAKGRGPTLAAPPRVCGCGGAVTAAGTSLPALRRSMAERSGSTDCGPEGVCERRRLSRGSNASLSSPPRLAASQAQSFSNHSILCIMLIMARTTCSPRSASLASSCPEGPRLSRMFSCVDPQACTACLTAYTIAAYTYTCSHAPHKHSR
jgi:hypothetical protein